MSIKESGNTLLTTRATHLT